MPKDANSAKKDPGHARPPAAPLWVGLVAFLVALVPLTLFWGWSGRPVAIIDAPSPRVPCLSYAPYRDGQTPFNEQLVIPPEQIAEDLEKLAGFTRCVRTYSVDQGLAEVPRIAHGLGLKVLLGVWIGREQDRNEREIAAAIDLARRYPETIRAVVVGNEVLLRGEQPPGKLAAMIARVRDAVPVPVTYADVWEFWQQNPEVAQSVDFVTMHTLPYWEDDPQPIDRAVGHALATWRAMSAEFAGKPVMIGEAGWPSAGRMRHGALPSPLNQARFVRAFLAAADREGVDVNLIEGFDQPWKRKLEGTVGGHWGLFDAAREQKFALQGPVSDVPQWRTLLAASAVLGGGLLLPLVLTGLRPRPRVWFGLALAAVTAAALLVSGAVDGLVSSLSVYDWIVFAVRWVTAALTAALVLPILGGQPALPVARPMALADLLDAARRLRRPARPWRDLALGVLRAVILFSAAATTLCLIADSRYRDFANPLYAVPALALLGLSLALRPAASAVDLREERFLAIVLAAGGLAVYVNEGLANLQALAWAAIGWTFAAAVFLERRTPRLRGYARNPASAPISSPPAAGTGP